VRTTRTGRPAAVRPLLVAALTALALVALLGTAVTAGVAGLLAADRSVSAALYAGDDRSRLVETVLQVLTAPGLTVFRVAVLLPVLGWLVLRRAWWTAGWVLAAAALVAPVTALLKEFFGRVRPQFAEGGARYETLSFPSGHSSGVAALVTVVLVLAWPRLSGAARRACVAAGGALALVVGLTRVLLGVHYPSDVVGGWALGLGWTLLVVLAFGGLPGGRAALPSREQATPRGEELT
jgi:undecaprenyl-diphosphatase